MTEYKVGQWYPWVATNDRNPPVHPKTKVVYMMANGAKFEEPSPAERIFWSKLSPEGGTVVAFKVVEEYQEEPREFWVNIYNNDLIGGAHPTEKGALEAANRAWGRSGAAFKTIKVREVKE